MKEDRVERNGSDSPTETAMRKRTRSEDTDDESDFTAHKKAKFVPAPQTSVD